MAGASQPAAAALMSAIVMSAKPAGRPDGASAAEAFSALAGFGGCSAFGGASAFGLDLVLDDFPPPMDSIWICVREARKPV